MQNTETKQDKTKGLAEYDKYRQQYLNYEITWEELCKKTKEYEWVFEIG